tara:strand:+ start:1445 stop:2362 length:918 start_codon:yes stop_codon:yes gene_type:complete
MKFFKYLSFFMAILFMCSAAFGQEPYRESGLYKSETYIGNNVYRVSENRWARAIGQASFDSTSWIWSLKADKLHKNKSRDTILVVPDSAAPEHITLIVWFHGLNGFRSKTFEKRLIPQMEFLVSGGNSFAVAIPELPWSANTSTRHSRQGRVWTKAGELEKYISDLKEHLEIWALLKHKRPLGDVRIVFVGHSAGGSAIKAASREGGLCRVSPEAIIWSDASYGRWLDSAWNGCIKDLGDSSELHVVVRKWDPPYKSSERIMKRIRKQSRGPQVFYQVLKGKDGWTHGRIGNNIFSITNIFPPGC